MHLLKRLVFLVVLLCTSCSGLPVQRQPIRVLFVGNSLTYVGNLPAVFSALATINGHRVASDMIVKGGATLAQRLDDGSVARALKENTYSVLVLQERGGDLTCSFGPESCIDSRRAVQALAALGKSKGAKVLLLGTYQSEPESSLRIVAAESAIATAAGIAYVEVSNTLQTLRREHPERAWLYPDGHPARDLTLLDAVLVYRIAFGSYPVQAGFTVMAPIYTSHSGLTASLRAADAPAPTPDTAEGITYSARAVRQIIRGAKLSGAR